MKFGHHGANHPVKDLDSGRVSITSQNHGFAVDEKTLPANAAPHAREPVRRHAAGPGPHRPPAFCFQGHPEASPGPHDIGLPVRPLRRADGAPLNAPKRTDLQSILIIGAGPIVIGQACEFDYSGAQACKALREEGYRVILVNSNPATIMTDPEMADATYIEPITWQVVEKIIAKERAERPTRRWRAAHHGRPDGAELRARPAPHGVLAKYGVEMIGANEHAIEKAEDRLKFKDAMTSIGLDSAKSGIAHSMEEALAVQKRIQAEIGGTGFPMVIRPSFTLGGTGGGIAYNPEEFEEICKRGLDLSPTKELLIEESLIGWKEYEMEVVRDRADNCIIVCSIENLDPMGIHTGDSITVAPGADADRQGIPADAQRQRSPSCARSAWTPAARTCSSRSTRERPHDRHRDEPARVALVGAGVQGHGLPDRQGGGQAGGGLHARRAAQRHHRRRHAGELRAQHRLRRHQDPALRLREVPRRRPAPDHADEERGRGDGHGPHLPGELPEGAARPGDRHRRPDERSTDRDEIVDEIGNAGPERILFVGDAFRIGMSAGRGLRGDRHRPLVPGADRGADARSSSSWPAARWRA
jgi:carbamoyl-phosphate synthase large subunit